MTQAIEIPEAGMAVLVRGRPAAVRDVRSHETDGPVAHLVDVEYLDGSDFPGTDSVLWEREIDARILTGGGLPRIDDGLQPDDPDRFAAYCDALRWSSVARLPGLTGNGVALISPWESAILPEAYQLYPVLKALEMPRVSLLLADDVGLGKTIEAGLVIRELIQRRRIRRILVICPASLQLQWRDELSSKFGLEFAVLNREKTIETQREYGMDANPWTVHPRVITSMDFLRQPDVLSSFLAGSDGLERSHALAWDLLVVDEAHNLAPLGFGERSDRSKMLTDVAQHAEHRLFLSATPHNGFTASFSGLLEILDPVRFRQTSALTEPERRQVDLVMVRRLKSDLNRRALDEGLTPPFTNRHVERIRFGWTREELAVVEALRAYRRAGHELLSRLGPRERSVGRFVFSLLVKRLLSSPYALARTWWAHVEGYTTEASLEEAEVAQKRLRSQTADDLELAERESDAARLGGAWLGRNHEALAEARDAVSEALRNLGWSPEIVESPLDPGKPPSAGFPPDGKWDALRAWVDERLRDGNGDFVEDERAIWFTEYKDTLDYITTRLAAQGVEPAQIGMLFGGSSLPERDRVRDSFNDPADPIRLLIATDVAAEGLNLQTSCRYVVHYEVPWNPMRLEQRNGRVDRHGQARDVTAFHFGSDEDEDTRFIDYVVRKVDQVRDDLGSVGDVIDRALEEHFSAETLQTAELDRRVDQTLEHASERLDLGEDAEQDSKKYGADAALQMEATELELRIGPDRLARLLTVASEIDRGRLEAAGADLFNLSTIPHGWGPLVDSSLRLRTKAAAGALPKLTFTTDALTQNIDGRRLFRERADTRLLRLAHPLMRRATATLRRRLWQPGADLSRFTIGSAEGVEAPTLVVQVLLTVVNELREPLHAELLELSFTIAEDATVIPATALNLEPLPLSQATIDGWRVWLEDRWSKIAPQFETERANFEAAQTKKAEILLPALRHDEEAAQRELFDSRIRELERDTGDAGRERLRREIAALEAQMDQLTFDVEHRADQEQQLNRMRLQLEEEEYRRLEERRARQRDRLVRDRDRLLGTTLPKRYTLSRCSVIPIGVALLVPSQETAT